MRAFVHESLPSRVVFGPGTVDRVGDEVARLDEPARVLVVASGSAKATGDLIGDALGSRCAASFDEVRQHVPEELAATAVAAARDVGTDCVVTVGGGSAIGLGKVVAVEVGIPLLAVPTTYSGSEMTPIYGVTGAHKRTARDLRALPRTVVYDPELTVGLPPRITASSGFNALAHCIEALYAPGASPITELWAEEAIWELGDSLLDLARQPDDLAARGRALYGACLAGSAFGIAGVALQHRLAHVVGGTFGLDHADTHAVLLPHVAAFNADTARDAMAWVAVALEGEHDHREVGTRLHELAVQIEAPTSLAAIGMPADGLDHAAALAVAAVGDTNPRPVDERSLRQLLHAAFEGQRP